MDGYSGDCKMHRTSKEVANEKCGLRAKRQERAA